MPVLIEVLANVLRGEAPPWLLEECAFDADEDIRASAQAGRLRA